MFLPASLALPTQIKIGVNETPQAALGANTDAEFTVFGIATGTAFLLRMGSSPHDILPASKRVAGKRNAA
jgi:hypothetical protein